MGTFPTVAAVSARVARGAANGLVATVAMTGVMLAARRLGLVDPPSPEAVVEGGLEKLDLADTVRPPARTALVAVSHLGYGSAVGAVFDVAMSRLGGHASATRGALYGLAVWAGGYMGWLPGFGILPPPSRQGAGRHASNISSHLVYGWVLGSLSARTRTSRRRRSRSSSA